MPARSIERTSGIDSSLNVSYKKCRAITPQSDSTIVPVASTVLCIVFVSVLLCGWHPTVAFPSFPPSAYFPSESILPTWFSFLCTRYAQSARVFHLLQLLYHYPYGKLRLKSEPQKIPSWVLTRKYTIWSRCVKPPTHRLLHKNTQCNLHLSTKRTHCAKTGTLAQIQKMLSTFFSLFRMFCDKT